MFRPRFSQRAGAHRPLRAAGSGMKSDPTMNRASGSRKGTDVSTRTPPGQNTGDQTVASNVASATWALDRARPAPSFPGTAGSACVRSSPLDDLEVPSSMVPSRSGDRTGASVQCRRLRTYRPDTSAVGDVVARIDRPGASRHGLSSRPTVTGTRVGRTRPRPFREPDQGPIDRSAGRLADGPSVSGCRGWPGPDAEESVSSAQVRAAGGRRGRPWCRSSERASADTGHNFR